MIKCRNRDLRKSVLILFLKELFHERLIKSLIYVSINFSLNFKLLYCINIKNIILKNSFT